EWRPYLSYLVARRQYAALARALSNDVLMHPRLLFWSSIRQMAGAKQHEALWRPTFPEWLNDEFAARCRSRERWAAFQHPLPSPPRRLLRRKKTAARLSADMARVATTGFPVLRPTPALAEYVNVARIPPSPESIREFRSALRPLGLNYWLGNLAV